MVKALVVRCLKVVDTALYVAFVTRKKDGGMEGKKAIYVISEEPKVGRAPELHHFSLLSRVIMG